MVRKYFVQQLGLLLMVSVIIILTNVIGYKMPVKDSIIGVLLLSAISLIGLTISKFMSRFVKLPSMMYVSLLGLLLACPVSPVKDRNWNYNSCCIFSSGYSTWCICRYFSGKRFKGFCKNGMEAGIDHFICNYRNLYILRSCCRHCFENDRSHLTII